MLLFDDMYLVFKPKLKALTSAMVKRQKGQILFIQPQKSTILAYLYIVQNAFLLQHLCKYTQAI